MTREDAARLLPKLQALTTERGATGPEAALAAEKAKALIARFGLSPHRPSDGPARVHTAPPADATKWTGGSQAARRPWSFDIKTGEASQNVKVHGYKNRREWKIEIFD